MNHIINFFGEGVRLWKCHMTTGEYNRLNKFRHKNNLSWDSIFFDLHVLDDLGYESWTDFSYEESLGLLINARNTIEVKRGAKKLLKISSSNVLNQGLLFDLYQTVTSRPTFTSKVNHISFFLVSYEIGSIGKYKISTGNFSINKLHFNIKQLVELNCSIIDGMNYDSVKVERISDDSITRKFHAII